MSYFSRLSVTLLERESFDRSHPSERERIMWRIEELSYRLEELMENAKCQYDTIPDYGNHIGDTEIDYILPEDLHTVGELLVALHSSQRRLEELDGQIVSVTTILPGQMVLAAIYGSPYSIAV